MDLGLPRTALTVTTGAESVTLQLKTVFPVEGIE
jgi:hypothetical protein